MEVLAFFLAALVGVSLGLIGGGGSILTVPILVYILGINPMLATSYSLFIVGFTALVGAFNNYRKGLLNIKVALLFGSSSIATVFISRKFILPHLPEIIFFRPGFQISQSMATMVLFAVLMLMASYSMITEKRTLPGAIIQPPKDINFVKLFVSGVLIGLITGFLGAGGGFLIIPVLVIIFQIPMKQAVGTSLLIIAMNSIIGFSGDIGHLTIDWLFLITMTLIAIAGIFIGAIFAEKVNEQHLKKAFGWFVLLMGIYILTKEILR
ncbi:MAG: sulfite exporter TauE/SafE family protein [Sphingobacteriaceae bacterium]